MNDTSVTVHLAAEDAVRGALVLFYAAFFSALILTPLIRDLALARGWVDRPDGRRKTHRTPVPRLGGIAVHLAFALSCGAALAVFGHAPWLGPPIPASYLHLLAAGTAVMVVGLLDDVIGVGPAVKILVQAGAGLYLYYNGYQIRLVANPFGETVNLGLLSLPITLLWFAGISNAFNLIDGLDGLAAGVGLFSTSVVVIIAAMNDRWEIVFLSVALGGALLGFLRYNFASASVFLGDSGSLFVGFALAALAVRGSMKSSMAVAVLAPLLALALPILDTTIAIARRFFGGKGLFEADAEHIHHRMLRKGLTPRWVVVILYSVAAFFGALSLLSMTGHSKVLGVVIILFSVGTWFGVQQLGYADLGALRWMLRHGLVRGRREPLAPPAPPAGAPAAPSSAGRHDPPAASAVLAASALPKGAD